MNNNYDIAIVLSLANFAVLRWLAPFKANPSDTASNEHSQQGGS